MCIWGADVFKFAVQLSYSVLLVTESSTMALNGKEISEDLKRRIIVLHEDGQGYKNIANILKLRLRSSNVLKERGPFRTGID